MSSESPAVRRRRRSRAQWQRLVAAQAASSESQAAWCRRRRIAYTTFCHWKRILGEPEAAPAEGVFVELEEPAAEAATSGEWDVELSLGAGMVLRLRRR